MSKPILVGLFLLCGAVLADEATSPVKGTRILETVLDVDQSTDATCGPAALEAILAHYGVQASEGAISADTNLDPEVGAQPEDLARVAEGFGIKTEWRDKLTLEDLEREIVAGNPVLILTQAWKTDGGLKWEEAWDDGHYLVVIGIDAKAVYCEDPSLHGERGVIPREEFLARWHGWTSDDEKAERQGMLFRRGTPAKAPPTKWVPIE